MRYFDTHAHYYDDRFAAESEIPTEERLRALFAGTVCAIVNVGTCVATSRLAVEQAKRFPRMLTAIGVHPTDGQGLSDPDAELAEIERMIRDPADKCVLLGEIGLDYHYPDTDKEKQKYLFDAQLSLAERLDFPVCIHDRDAHGDTLEMLRAHPNVRGILHSFSGSAEMVSDLLRIGEWYVSFSGTVTFTNARKTVEAAAVVPHDRLLIETDCPYLAPRPLRGTLNHSGNLVYTNARLAEILGIPAEECAAMTAENAVRLLHLPSDFADQRSDVSSNG